MLINKIKNLKETVVNFFFMIMKTENIRCGERGNICDNKPIAECINELFGIEENIDLKFKLDNWDV